MKQISSSQMALVAVILCLVLFSSLQYDAKSCFKTNSQCAVFQL